MKNSRLKGLGRLFALLIALTIAVPTGLKLLAAEVDADGYIIVRSVDELKAVHNNPTGKYKLYEDIDLSAGSWSPIGYAKFFKGTFDGNGHTISGLWSAKNGLGYKGLFSVLEGATVKNLTIALDDRGITGIYECGGLAGVTQKGAVIDNVTVKGGKIIVTGGGYAGGLIGISRGGQYGGLPDTITNCTVIDTVTQTSGNYSGGFIGALEGRSVITNSSCVNTESKGFSYVAGFVGVSKSQSVIDYCAANGSAVGTGSYSGGFAGAIYEKSTIQNSEASGNVSAKLSYAGGFAGAVYNDSTVICCRAEGDVSTALSYAGGFAGAVYNESDIAGAYAYGNVKAKHYAGGLIGTLYDDSTVFKSCAYGNVGLTNGYIAGGLIGEAVGSTINNCYARGDVDGGTGAATGVGGLVGYFSLAGSKTVNNSYSSGKVTGKGKAEYGAFSGMTGVIFLGTNYYDSDKAAAASATGTSGHPQGLDSSFPQGKGTEAMMKQATFQGWDFVNIWKIDEGQEYPYFDQSCPIKSTHTDGKVDVAAQQPEYEISENSNGSATISFDVKFTPADIEKDDFFVSFSNAAGETVSASALGASEPQLIPNVSTDGLYVLSFTVSDSVAASVLAKGHINADATVRARQSDGAIVSGSDSTIIKMLSAPDCSVVVAPRQPEYVLDPLNEDKTMTIVFDVQFTPADLVERDLSIAFKTELGQDISDIEELMDTASLTLVPDDSVNGAYVLSVDFTKYLLVDALDVGNIIAEATVSAEHQSGATASGSGSTTITLKKYTVPLS